MSYYCTPEDVRFRLKIREQDGSDIHMKKHITDAQLKLLKDISGYRIDEELYGTIDGTNVYFYTDKQFIADRNFDMTVDSNDLTVYLWTDASDPSTKSTATVSAVNSTIGQITLASAPTSGTAMVTCDYRFYNSYIEDWQEVTTACAYLAGYYWVIRDRLLLPDNVSFGGMRWRISFPQWRELYTEYARMIHALRGKMVIHGNMSLPERMAATIPEERFFSRSTSTVDKETRT